MTLSDRGHIEVGGARLEYRMVGPRPQMAPTLVLLHDGLGAVAAWHGFDEALAQATGVGVFSYSRAGCGRSSAAKLPRPASFLHDEACEVLPRVLDAIGFRRGLLLGHGDGASIAAIYAGSVQDHRVRGLALMAPHFFAEETTLAEIARAKAAFETGLLRDELGRLHADPANAFYNWCGPWLNPALRKWDITDALAHIRVPILIVQGKNDQYATVRQIEVAQQECYCPVEVTLLPQAGHAPQTEAPAATLSAVVQFTERLLRDHHEGDLAPISAAGSSPAR